MQIRFGAMSAELCTQMNVNADEVEIEQKLADAITLCNIQSVLTDAETHKARKRIVKRLEKKGF